MGALQACKLEGTINDRTVGIETAPESVRLGFAESVLRVEPGRLLPSLRRTECCWKTLSQSITKAYIAGVSIPWSEYHKEYERSLPLLDLPGYAFVL